MSDWIKHVKKYAKTHGIKYGEALKQASSTFHSSSAPAPAPAPVKKSKANRKSSKSVSKKNRRSRRR